MRIRAITFLFLGFFLVGSHVFGETLARLEAIVAPYSTLADFLKDPKAVSDYKEAYKLYLGDDSGFDRVFDEFIEQLKSVVAEAPEFAEKAWKTNPNWESESYVIRGEFTGSGLEIRRQALSDALEKTIEEAKTHSAPLTGLPEVQRKQEIEALVARLKSKYRWKPANEVAGLSRKAQAEYRASLVGIAESAEARLLSDYIAHELLTRDEKVSDAMHSGDADIIINELKRLEKPVLFKSEIQSMGLGIPDEIVGYLRFSNEPQKAIVQAYENGVSSIKSFQHIADPRIPPELLAEIQRLEQGGIGPALAEPHLSLDNRRKLYEHKRQIELVNSEKNTFAQKHNSENAFFFYDLHKDPDRGTLRLKTQGGLELHFIPSPRAFHGFLAGRKTGECVGGRDCGGLTPRRWARAALEGANTVFTETGNHRMEGFIGITPLTHQPTASRYDVIDIMSRALKGDVAIKGPNGRTIKYSFFDLLIDSLKLPNGSQGFVISDGNSVSQNVGGGEVVNHSPTYLEDVVIGKPADFTPADPIAHTIATRYSEGLYGGGMIYDGMKGDGTKVVKLVPSSERRKWTREELESQILDRVFEGKEVPDKDVLWKRALESGVPLKSVSSYRRAVQESLESFDTVLKYLKDPRFPHFPDYYFKHIAPWEALSKDPNLQDRLVDYLLETARGNPTDHDQGAAQTVSENLSHVHLQPETSQKIIAQLSRVVEGKAKNSFFIVHAIHVTDPNWFLAMETARKWIKGLKAEDSAEQASIRAVLSIWVQAVTARRDYAEPRTVRAFDLMVSLFDDWHRFIISNISDELKRDHLLRDSYDKMLTALMRQARVVAFSPHTAKLLLNLPIGNDGLDIFPKVLGLLNEDPTLINDLVRFAGKNWDGYRYLKEMASWLENNPHHVDPKKAKLIIRLAKGDGIGFSRSVLAWVDYLFMTGPTYYYSPHRRGLDNWEDVYKQQRGEVENNRLQELATRWEEIEAGTPFSARAKRQFQDGCANAMRALRNVKENREYRLSKPK